MLERKCIKKVWKQGDSVKYENIGKISQAVKVFKSTTEPTIMVYSNNQVHKQGLFHNPENFIMLEYQQPLYISSDLDF